MEGLKFSHSTTLRFVCEKNNKLRKEKCYLLRRKVAKVEKIVITVNCLIDWLIFMRTLLLNELKIKARRRSFRVFQATATKFDLSRDSIFNVFVRFKVAIFITLKSKWRWDLPIPSLTCHISCLNRRFTRHDT
jgi:hypothetical protein